MRRSVPQKSDTKIIMAVVKSDGLPLSEIAAALNFLKLQNLDNSAKKENTLM